MSRNYYRKGDKFGEREIIWIPTSAKKMCVVLKSVGHRNTVQNINAFVAKFVDYYSHVFVYNESLRE